MATIIHSSFELSSTLLGQAGRDGQGVDCCGETNVAGQNQRFSSQQSDALQQFLQCETADADGSRKLLEGRWRKAAEQVGIAARDLRNSPGRTMGDGSAKLISENLTTLKEALSESLAGIKKADELPHVTQSNSGEGIPRSFALACMLLKSTAFRFDEQAFAQFLARVQESISLEMSEVWNLKPFLELALLGQIAEEIPRSALLATNVDSQNSPALDAAIGRLAALLDTLVCIAAMEWKVFFERVSLVERILRMDPQGSYPGMDSETRETYRAAVADFAEHSGRPEPDIARRAIAHARFATENASAGERARERRAHVGYYLVDDGQSALKEEIDYRPALAGRMRDAILKSPDLIYVLSIEVVTFAIAALLVSVLHVKYSNLLGIALILFPALECGVAIVNMVSTRLVPPKKIPKLDFSKGIPQTCATVVAVPVLMTSEAQVRQAVQGLEVRYLANRDPNLHFALLTDLPDSKQEFDDGESLVDLSSSLMQQLDQKYAGEFRGRFFLFHRHRKYNEAEGLWMGWERKRGKLLDFNRFLLNEGDEFPVKTGDTSFLKNIRYVITLDLDTQLPPGAARKLVGTLAHPLNRAVIDPEKNTVVEGYGILQPRVDISVRSASRSRFASLLSGDTGFDMYTRAISDVYQDLFGEGIFTGKGIYEVQTFQRVLEHRFPCNTVLSHDLIEGVYARAGLVSDVEIVDDYPSHFSAFSRRKHRWVRGDWQILFSLFPQFENYFGQMVFNPMSYISRWKVFDNLRRSLTDFAAMLLLLYGWMLPPSEALRWTIAAVALILFPACFQPLLAVFTGGKAWFRRDFWQNLGRDFAGALARTCVRLAFLCHQSLIDVDAVVRTIVRMKFTHRRLLEWETAAAVESQDGSDSFVDVYLKYSLLLTVAMGPLVYFLHPRSLLIALPFLILWAASAWIGEWLNQRQLPLASRIKPGDRDMIRNAALRTWRFFREFSTAAENWLIPDIVQDDPPLVAHRISPTNLGLLLNSRLAAHDLGYLTTQEFIRDTERTMDAARRMPKCDGHFYNWYETESLEAVSPRFVSTVDNGNLVSSLWTLKQGCLDMIQKPLLNPELWAGLRDIAIQLAEAVRENAGGSDFAAVVLDLRERAEEIGSEDALLVEELRTLELDALMVLGRAMKGQGTEDVVWWARELSSHAASLRVMIETFAPWLDAQFADACPLSRQELRSYTQKLALESIPRIYRDVLKKLKLDSTGSVVAEKAKHLHAILEKSALLGEDFVNRLTVLASASQSMADAMDFSSLVDQKKKQFSVGYEEAEGAISKYNYDLLASEARTAVFVAIAKGEAIQEIWFRLKRSYRNYKGEAVLLSWSGTTFEYLMPCLWLRKYPNTLLGQGVQAVLQAQQKFAAEHGIPWGISESSCADRNADGHYRYHAFGVPGLALHQDDCSGDLVVAPYATFLGMMFDIEAALENLRRLKDLGLLSAYGFYEAADFTPKRNSEGKGHVVVRNWMAHHQGMSLVAAANVLCNFVMQRRFHAEPRVAAIERLLHERQPRVLPYEEDVEVMKESSPALADLTAPHPVFRDLVPKVL